MDDHAGKVVEAAGGCSADGDEKTASTKSDEVVKAAERRTRSNQSSKKKKPSRTRSNQRAKKKSLPTLLKYPFNISEDIHRQASSGMMELGGNLLGVDTIESLSDESMGKSSQGDGINITAENISRLRPGQFLDDALVSFWMKW